MWGFFSKKQKWGSDLGYLYDPKTDPIPTRTQKYDRKPDPNILKPVQNLSGRVGPGQMLSPVKDHGRE